MESIQGFLGILTLSSITGAVIVSDFTTVEVGGKCLYVSKYKIWPFLDNNMDENTAQAACYELLTDLATIENEEENIALQEYTRCILGLEEDENILINAATTYNPSEVEEGKNCYFQMFDGSHVASDDQNCQSWFNETSGEPTKPVYFVCKKNTRCSQFPNCVRRTNDLTKCYQYFGNMKHAEAKAKCDASFGYLPKITAEADYQEIPNQAWVGLTTDVSPINHCGGEKKDGSGVANCIASQQGFYWDGGRAFPKTPLIKDHSKFMRDMSVDRGDKCFIRHDNQMHDEPCDMLKEAYCTIDLGPNGMEKNIAQPNYLAGTFTCGPPNEPPTETNLALNSSQPVVMCLGQQARYICEAGGINIREDDHTKSTLDVTCMPNQEYAYPNPWPMCIDRLNCSTPPVDKLNMEYDWTTTTGFEPEFTVEYRCKAPKKKIISRRNLAREISTDLHETLGVNCQLNGTYDINIEDYACTRSCPIVIPPEPDRMTHDGTGNETTVEIFDEIRYSCLYGRHLVSKEAFGTGEPTELLDEILTSCQVRGQLNGALGSYTCSRGCEPPYNHSDVFTFDWDPSKGSDIGTEVKYVCNNPERKIANLIKPNLPLHDELTITCLYNGKYNMDIKNFGCTECERRTDPPNGKTTCESNKYQEGKSCFLECDAGYIPSAKTQATCSYDIKKSNYVWSVDEANFQCVEPIGFVIGGQDVTTKYLDNVEILAPGFNCSEAQVPPYPLKVVGASTGFLEGKAIVCGGGVETYADCRLNSEGSRTCNRNTDCIKTAGGSLWCTGPKTKLCYSYDPVGAGSWKLATELKTPRAYAASAVMSDGTFWVIGGSGSKEILKSTEKLVYVRGSWRRSSGPSIPITLTGACASPINVNELVVIGGFSADTNDFNAKAYLLDTTTNTWKTKPWAKLETGPKFDIACSQVNWHAEKYILLAGGWNNSAAETTEVFNTKTFQYTEVLANINNSWRKALPLQIRSAVMAELDKAPTLAGGVICTGNFMQKQECQRTNKIFQLVKNSNSNTGFDAYWQENTDIALKIARTGHSILIVPKMHAPLCGKTKP